MDRNRNDTIPPTKLIDLFNTSRTLIDSILSPGLLDERDKPFGNCTHPLSLPNIEHELSEILACELQLPLPSLCSDDIAGDEDRDSSRLHHAGSEALTCPRHSNTTTHSLPWY